MDWISKKFIRGPENEAYGTPSVRAEAFKNFVADKGSTLEGILGSDGVNTLRAISNDLSRNARSYTEAKLPGGPGTAQDLTGAQALNVPNTLIGHFAQQATKGAAAIAAWTHMGLVADAAAVVGRAMASNNIQAVNDLATRMVLDPQFAAQAFAKIPPKSSPTAQMAWAQRLARGLTASTLTALQPHPAR